MLLTQWKLYDQVMRTSNGPYDGTGGTEIVAMIGEDDEEDDDDDDDEDYDEDEGDKSSASRGAAVTV